jgi:dihydroflavonol-4-reductase
MSDFSVVTGANGHLGNNLVRFLLDKGETVVAGIRRGGAAAALEGLGSRIATLDLNEPDSLAEGFAGARNVYLVGAVFKHWARNPEKEIYEANLAATRNALEAAAKAGVGRIVYVSSLAAADHSRRPITETGWNTDTSNVYYRSKTDSEKLAWQLADRHGLEMVSVLPGTMIGGRFDGLTPPMELLQNILDGKLDVNPGFWFNFVDVREVAEASWMASERGRSGERYLLANEDPTSVEELVAIARRLFPDRNIPVPRVLPRPLLWLVAYAGELWSTVSKTPPRLQRNFLRTFTVQEHCDNGKARRELEFHPRPPVATIEESLRDLVARSSHLGRRIQSHTLPREVVAAK